MKSGCLWIASEAIGTTPMRPLIRLTANEGYERKHGRAGDGQELVGARHCTGEPDGPAPVGLMPLNIPLGIAHAATDSVCISGGPRPKPDGHAFTARERNWAISSPTIDQNDLQKGRDRDAINA